MLALDTSTFHLSAAVVERAPEGGPVQLLAQRDEGPPKKQSELLPGVLEELLSSVGKQVHDLELLAVGMGPGSFTGLRIGLATLKGLAYAQHLRVGAASSLAALALAGPEGVVLYACGLARQGELYVGAYRRQGQGVTLLAPEDVQTPAELAAKLQADSSARVLGPGLDSTEAQLLTLGVQPAQVLPAPRFPSALAVATLAKVPDAYDPQALFALEPHYLKASAPELNPKFPPLPGPAPVARLKDE